MTQSDAAERSRAAFAKRFPHLIDAALAAGAPSSVIFEGDTPVDISFGDRRLYGGDARASSRERIEDFLQKPLRLIMDSPTAAGLVSKICIDLMQAMNSTLEDEGVTELSRGPVSAPTFLVIFGIGLGYHIGELIRRTGARWVIIAEPFPEFIGHSFKAVDWQEIFDQVDAAEGDIQIVGDLDPGELVVRIMREVGQHGVPYLDGTWVFTHYPLWAFAEAAKRLHGAAEFAYVNRGFFEDELVMLTNAVTTFASHPFWLLDAKPRLHRPETVVIAGAGPSLDEAIETLHQIRDRVVLFSAGTALRPLLRAGLVPDFHCELENGPQVFEVISEAKAHGDLSSVRLIASATVDPRVPPLFRESILFFRDSVSSTMIIGGDAGSIFGAAPTCVNTAAATATALGFTEFILFGVDCGLRPGMPDHAEGTIYRDLEKWKERIARYPLEVEGNFGGIAMTNWVYDASRRLLIDLIHAYRLNVVNCSDGALIPGATPRVPETLAHDGTVIDQERIIGELKRALKPYRPGEMVQATQLATLREQAKAMYGELRTIVDGFDSEAADFAGVFSAMSEFVRNAGDRYGKVESIPDGSLRALPRIGMFYGCRILENAPRRRLFAAFRRELIKAFDSMETETDALLKRLAERVEVGAAAAAG